MKKPVTIACWLMLAAALSACQSPSVPSTLVLCPQLPPAPAAVMVKREPSFQTRLQDFLSGSPLMPTP